MIQTSSYFQPFATGTVLICVTLGWLCDGRASHANELESIAALDLGGQVAAIGERLIHNAEALADKTIDISVRQSGIVRTPQDTNYGAQQQSGTASIDLSQGTHKLRLVTSKQNGYEEFYLNNKRAISIFGKTDCRVFLFDSRNQMTQVTIHCSPQEPSLDLVAYLHTTLASGWRGYQPESESKADVNEFVALMHTLELTQAKIEDVDGLGQALVLTFAFETQRDDPRALSTIEYYFGWIDDKVVFRGDDTLNRSTVPDGSNRVSVHRTQRRVAYKSWDGNLLPSSWTHRTASESLDAQMKPLGIPFVFRDTKNEVVSCRILDNFPTALLEIPIPASAKIHDACKRSQQQDVAAVVESAPQRQRNWWLLAAGVTLIIGGASSWIYYRKIK